MASSYSTDLKLELMVTGENAGTWGDKTNTNLNLLQQAIAGYQAVSIAGGAQTTALVMSNATISNARNAVVKLTGTITGNQIVTIPDGIEKTYIVENGTTGAFTVEFKTASGTGPTFSTTDKGIKIVYSDGTNVVDVNANLSGPTLASDLNVNGKSIISTSNGNIVLAPNGTGDVQLDADTVRIGDSNTDAILTTNGTGDITISTNSGTNSGTIKIFDGTNGDIEITPNGTGVVKIDGLSYPTADGTANQVLKTNGSGVLSFATPSAGFSGSTITSSAVDITLTNASTQVQYVTMTATGKSVILPDATTLATEGSPIYVIYNDGIIPFFIKNSAGVILITAPPSNIIELTLLDNSTSSGSWSSQYGVINLSSYNFQAISTTTNGVNADIFKVAPYQNGINLRKIDSSTFIFTYHAGTSKRDVYGVVCSYSGNTITVNSEVLLYNGSTTAATASQMVMLDATTGLLVVMRAANSIAVPFTVSGTTITAGTASSTFGTANSTSIGNIDKGISMSSTLALFSESSTDASTTKKFRVIQHNGASAPTIGTLSTDTIILSDQALTVQLSKIDATNAFCAFSGASNLSACVITISGTSAPTRGTVNTSGGATGQVSDIFADSSSQFIVFGYLYSAKYTVSGTTVTHVSSTSYTTYGTWGSNSVALLNGGGNPDQFQITTGNGWIGTGSYEAQIYYYQRSGDAYFPKQSGITWQINNQRFYIPPFSGTNCGGITLDSTTIILWTTITGTTSFVATVIKEL